MREGDRPVQGGGRDYEVVRPIKLHALHKRDTQASRPDEVWYGMSVGGRDIEMHLERNQDLLSEHYSETHYTPDGTRVTSTLQDLDHCYYHGRIVNDSQSAVSVSTCNGLRGYLRTASQQYLLEPLSDQDTGDHALLRYDTLTTTLSTCGVTSTSWEPIFPSSTTRGRSRASEPSPTEQPKYMELFLVADNSEYKRMKSDLSAVRSRMFEIVNFINKMYQPLNTSIVLIGLEVWTDRDRIRVVPAIGQTLSSFTDWRNEVLMKTNPHDNAQLITAVDFDGLSVGLAYVGTLCSVHSTGVVQDHNSRAVVVGATLTHEIGHNLGMRHDEASCTCGAGVSCIMAASLSPQVPRRFSGCSVGAYGDFLRARRPWCLFDRPDIAMAASWCGDGVLDPGEECDCGDEEECTDPCCHAPTCRLTPGSQCAAGECCDNCKFTPASKQCRSQRDECDLAEYCTGKSPRCPEDVFSFNGTPCKEGRGYCYNGQCPLLAEQCVTMWGDTAQVGGDTCYDRNTQGTIDGFCQRRGPQLYDACREKDVRCGRLFCSGGKDTPLFGEPVGPPDCRAAVHPDPTQDRGQVADGTKCGDAQVCSRNACVDLEMAYGGTNCSARCRGHAVCNHKSECQCEPGWIPPDCDTMDSSDQILSLET
ncbi:disintegrin and metalloproteinase domain-containing protein 28-like [Megalops cyprinoides]|uniref:disintegrin and metalloproteinase domain-containing protein 28-like n=1 Tax=Megalops cyprinoides TaxID=118141 RepID=UPI0018654E51|nr:disintegrin and metalloproteinase domain-containing protein 28-like [Megalops cyprinoides]